MTKFELGKTYTMRSACDHDCEWTFKVIARTEKTITLDNGGKTIKCRINKFLTERNNQETVLPLGNYSMAPVLRA